MPKLATIGLSDVPREALLAALMKLPYRQREVVVLRYGIRSGYRYRSTRLEVGRIFRVSRKRVHSIERKAVAKLQDLIRSEGVGTEFPTAQPRVRPKRRSVKTARRDGE